IDDIPERPALEIGAQIVAEEIDGAMTVLITGRRDMRRDQYPRIGPEPRHLRVLLRARRRPGGPSRGRAADGGHVSRISPSYQPPASVNSIAGSTASIFARSSAPMC